MLSTKRHLTLGILTGLTALGTSIAAYADTPQSTVILNTATQLAYHAPNSTTGKPPARRDGAGVMDTTMAFDRTTGDIVSFWTNSVPWGNGTGLDTGMQAAMAFTKMTPTGLAPTTVKMLPNQSGGQRVFMRPNALLGKDFAAVVFADENDGPNADGNPQAVIWVYDRQGNQLNVTNSGDVGQGPHDPVNLISLAGQQDGQQQCPHSACQMPDAADGTQRWVMGVQRNNQNARLMRVDIKSDGAGGVTVKVPYIKTIVQNAQHDRVMIACPTDGLVHGGAVVATTVEADGQPANYGVDAVLFDTEKGAVLSKTRVYDSDPQNGLYAVQPTTQYINDSVVAFQFQVSDAVRVGGPNGVATIGSKCNRNNGHCAAPQQSHLVTMSIPAAGGDFQTIEATTKDAPYGRHSEAFGMNYGPATSAGGAVGVIAGSSDAMGAGLLQVIPIDSAGHIGALDPMKVYQVSQYSDVAQLPAMTKRDPGQARGFIHGLYGVQNPSYGDKTGGGFMPTVKTFNISAVAGYADPTTDNRESLTFALIPAVWDPAVATTPGGTVPISSVPPGPAGTPPASAGSPVTNPGPGLSTGGGTASQGGTTGTGGGIKTGYGLTGTDASSGCGCTTAGSDQTSGLAGIGLMGLGFAFLGMRRNKKES